jgi:hypothetical protein
VIVKKINCWEYGEGGEEFKVPHHASAVAAYDGNMLYVKATCLMSRQHALNNGHLPLFLTISVKTLRGVYYLKNLKISKINH